MSMPIIMQDEEQAMVDKSLGSCLELKYNIMDGTENTPRFKRKNYHLNKLTCNNKVSFIMNDTTTSCCNVGYWPNPNGPSGNSVICSYCGRTINNWFQNYKQRIMLLTYRSLKVNENGNLVMAEMFQKYGVNESTKIIFSHSIRVFHVFNPKRGLLYNISYQDNKRLFFHTKKALFHYGGRGESFLFSYFCKKLREKHLGFKLDLKDLNRVGESYKFFLLLRYPNLIPLMDKSVSDDTLLDEFFKIPYNKRKKLDSSLDSFSKVIIGYKSKVLLEVMKIRFISRGAGDFPSLVMTFKTLNILFGKDKALKLIQSNKILSPIISERHTEKIDRLKEEVGCKRFFNLLMKEAGVTFNTLSDIANNVEIIKNQKPNYSLPRVNSVEELHRKTSRIVRRLKDKPIVFNYTKEETEIFNQEVDGVVFKLVKSSNRLKSASTLLNNCLYGYRDQITIKDYYIILIYKDRVLLGAISAASKDRVVTQCKLWENLRVNKDRRLNEICKKYFKKTGCVYDRCMDLKHDDKMNEIVGLAPEPVEMRDDIDNWF